MSPVGHERDAFELTRRANVLLPGVYAWAATVLYPAALRGVGVAPKLLAALAFVLLIAGAAFGTSRAAIGRVLGLHGFVAACVATWVVLGASVSVDRLEPIRAALGGIGWVVFAFGWGASRERESVPEDDPRVLPGAPLRPRGHLPRGAMPVLAAALTGAALPLLIAWRVTRESHALLAHAVAIACAVALVSSGAEIAVRRGEWKRTEPMSRRIGQAAIPLAALAVVLLIGAVGFFVG